MQPSWHGSHTGRDDLKGAVVACTQLLDTKSQDVNFQTRTDINRGNAYDQLGEPERAIADYVRALELDPRDAYAHRNKGVARTRLGRLGEAMQEFAAAVELKPDYAEAYGSRAEILRRMAPSSSESERAALYQRALADYNKTISLGLGPREAVAYKGRGFVNYYLAHLDAAIADFTNAIALSTEPSLLMARAIAYADTGDFTRATADIEKASTIASNAGISAANAAGITPAALQSVRDYTVGHLRRFVGQRSCRGRDAS